MPPKKPKKDKKKKAKKPKKVTLAALPTLPTGFNRPIPSGILGGVTPASYLAGGYASRTPPPATPIQTPDQFAIQRSLVTQSEAIQNVIEEQKAVRKERSDKGKKRGSYKQPEATIPLNVQIGMQSPSVSLAEAEAAIGSSASVVEPSIKKVRKSKTKFIIEEDDYIMQPPPTPPPVISSELFAGGAPVREQGLAMGMNGRLRGSPPNAATSLVGIESIGDSDFLVSPPTGFVKQG